MSAARTRNKMNICSQRVRSATEFHNSVRSNDGSRSNRNKQYMVSSHNAGIIGNGKGLNRKPRGKSTNNKANSAINFQRILNARQLNKNLTFRPRTKS